MGLNPHLAREVLRLRLSQLLINEQIKAGRFLIPIHLALGHEALAVAVAARLAPEDRLVLSHRNVHYHLAVLGRLEPIWDEYLLRPDGVGQGHYGSMNLANPAKGILYTSSILGNNLGVAAGLALARKVKKEAGVIIVVTGDGGMEEGAFYESLVFLKTFGLPALVIVENNGWSLATRIRERRCEIDLKKMTSAIGIPYAGLKGNNPYDYAKRIGRLRNKTAGGPVCVEVMLSTLGYWYKKEPDHPQGRLVNYHANAAPEAVVSDWPVLAASDEDPVHVLSGLFAGDMLKNEAARVRRALEAETA